MHDSLCTIIHCFHWSSSCPFPLIWYSVMSQHWERSWVYHKVFLRNGCEACSSLTMLNSQFLNHLRKVNNVNNPNQLLLKMLMNWITPMLRSHYFIYTKLKVLRCQYKGGKRNNLEGLSVNSTIADLQEKIWLMTDVPPHAQRSNFFNKNAC